MKNISLVIIGIISVILLSFFLKFVIFKSNTNSPTASNRIRIVASFYPLYFFASEIGGDKADIINLTPASTEPHDFEPTAQDIARIENSQMLIISGNALEAWSERVENELKGKNVLIITAGENLANKQLEEAGKTIPDPHVWLSPTLAKIEAENIEKGFEQIDPSNKSYYQNNLMRLAVKFDSLDKEYSLGLSSCRQKNIVTSHDAFGYLALQYHFTQIAISGISPDEEPSTQKLVEITNLVKQKGIKVIFFESLMSPKLSQTIAQETQADTMVLNPIEGLTSQDLQQGKNYITVMEQNLTSLKQALQCSK